MIDFSYIAYIQQIANQIIARGQSLTDFSDLSERRLFSEEFLKKQGIFYCSEEEYEYIGGYDNLTMSTVRFGGAVINCWIYPLKMHNVIVGWCAWNPEDGEYTNLFFQGVIKSQIIFGLTPDIYESGTAILVEGITDKYRIDYCDLKGGCGLMGNKITDYNRMLLKRVKRKIFIPDRDSTGMDAMKIWDRMVDGEKYWILLDGDVKDIDQRLKEKPELVPQFVALIKEIEDGSYMSGAKIIF